MRISIDIIYRHYLVITALTKERNHCAGRKPGDRFTEIKVIKGTFIIEQNTLLNELRFTKRKHSLPISTTQQ